MDHAEIHRSRTLTFRRPTAPAALLFSMVACATATAHADLTLRVQMDVAGNFLLIGNTLAQECDPEETPVPVVGMLGDCPNANAFAPDVYWRVDSTTGTAIADSATTATEASSAAVLALPEGALVTYARLYWGGLTLEGEADPTVRLQQLGSDLDAEIASTEGITVPPRFAPAGLFYQSTADVSEIVAARGAGTYLVTDVDSTLALPADLPSRPELAETVAAWYMIVFYQRDGEPQRNLAIFDGLQFVDAAAPSSIALSGFTVPNTGFDASLGVVAFEGEELFGGDSITFNGSTLGDAVNPADNFFNASRGRFGVPVSVQGDLPQLSGAPSSLSNVDLDVVDVTAFVRPGDTSARVEAVSSVDVYLQSAFITSITTLTPSFAESVKKASLRGDPRLEPGDTIDYTVVARNDGNDAAQQVVLRDPLPQGVTFVPGSLQVLSGPGGGPQTDAVGDDQGEYNAAERTVVVRLGAGATNVAGGTIGIGQEREVTFQVTVDPGTTGVISNQAVITFLGQAGTPETETLTDGDPTLPGQSTTDVAVHQCQNDTQCQRPTPYCDATGSAGLCVACVHSGHCADPAAPNCDPDTHTCQCAAGPGQCGECLVDSDCGTKESGRICLSASKRCVDGCRAVGGNNCGAGELCSSTTDAPGECRLVLPPMPFDRGEFAGGGGCEVAPNDHQGPGMAAVAFVVSALLWTARRRRGRGSRP